MAGSTAFRNRKQLSPVILITPLARTANPHAADRGAGSALHTQSQAKKKKNEKNKVWSEEVFQAAGSPVTKGSGKQDLCWEVVVMLCNTDIIESGSLRRGWAKSLGCLSNPFGWLGCLSGIIWACTAVAGYLTERRQIIN